MPLIESETEVSVSGLMDVDTVQKALNRSRASVYRYANTNPDDPNPAYDPKKLNPELRSSPSDMLLFHPNEVARFARDVLKIKQVTIEIQESRQNETQELLQAILSELREIHQTLKSNS